MHKDRDSRNALDLEIPAASAAEWQLQPAGSGGRWRAASLGAALLALSCAATPSVAPQTPAASAANQPTPPAPSQPPTQSSAPNETRELTANVVTGAAEPAAEPSNDASHELPSRCAEAAAPAPTLTSDSKKPAGAAKCFPPKDFVDQLCSAARPSTSLHLFHKTAPWVHAFLKTKTKAWNAARRGTSSDSWLARHEEVLLLAEQESAVDGGAVGFTALRWDGNCVFLTQAELMDYRPWQPPSARLDWDKFEPTLKEALRKDPAIQEVYRKQRQACRGMRNGTQDSVCQSADEQLSLGIAEYVRRGGELPLLEHNP